MVCHWSCTQIIEGTFFFFDVSPYWDHRTQAHWLMVLSFSIKFIWGYSAGQPLTKGHNIVQPHLSFAPDSSRQSPRSASLSSPMLGTHTEYVPMFPFLHRISCMRESLLSSSCTTYTADWYVQSRALPAFCNISCPVYSWIEHTYRLVSPDIVGWSHTFHWLSTLSVSFFQSNFLFWT